ncbi:hypothetical protein [Mycolicibacter heraklionensis]|uniref:hypothetical protein n=1 Tax=Mycolicibacter heraklionensis TaxID=512402 RepID=UPI00103D8DA4|nr:hypothetical protein [Mycolicibacter heraklionensis]
MSDWVDELLPGEGTAIPSDAERLKADELIGGEIPRRRDDYLRGSSYSVPTNRAFLRAQIRRWWRRGD